MRSLGYWICCAAAFVILFFAAALIIPLCQTSGEKVLIDTDGGIDDLTALFLLFSNKHQPVNVVSITTTYGLTDIYNATRNVLTALHIAGKQHIPVHVGLAVPLMYNASSDYYTSFRNVYGGYDGLNDVLPNRAQLTRDHKVPSAVFNIIDSVRRHPGEMTLFCLGPLSNVALASRVYPNLLKEVKQIYALGGSTRGDKEFNFSYDPEATNIVLEGCREVKMHILPFEVAQNANITWGWRKEVLGMIDSEEIKFLNTISLLDKQSEDGNWADAASDSYLAAIFLTTNTGESVVEMQQKYNVTVEGCVAKNRGSVHLNEDQNASQEVFLKLNTSALQNLYSQYLS